MIETNAPPLSQATTTIVSVFLFSPPLFVLHVLYCIVQANQHLALLFVVVVVVVVVVYCRRCRQLTILNAGRRYLHTEDLAGKVTIAIKAYSHVKCPVNVDMYSVQCCQ